VAILLTHGHPDHRAAVGRFPDAIVLALAAEEPLIAGREAGKGPLSRWFPARPTGVTVDRPLSDGEAFTIGAREFRVFAVPGHTPGSAAYLVDEMLFIGDSADTATDGTLSPATWIFSDDQAVNRASLVALSARLKAEGVRIRAVVPAHSGPMTNGLAELDRFASAQP
jgi:glyoxylase-like metal-dependent hydrolase (beta-lactamase superfamily II)